MSDSNQENLKDLLKIENENSEDDSDTQDDDDDDDDENNTNKNNPKSNSNDNDDDDDDSNDDDDDNSDDDDSDDDSDDDIGEEEEESADENEVEVTMQDNIVMNAAIDAARRLYHAQVHSTPTGNIAAMRTTGEIFSLGNRIPWEIVNPMGVNPKDSTKSIFSYDITTLPETVEARPWRAPDVDPSDWFNYGFNETTWEKYRKKMYKVIKNKKYESKISVLSEQTKK